MASGRRDYATLLTEHGVDDAEKDAPAAIAGPRYARNGWWRDYADIVSAGRQDLKIMEALASKVLVFIQPSGKDQ